MGASDVDLFDPESFAADLATLESDAFISDALQKGTTLRDYSKKVERELRAVEVESVRDYVQQSSQVAGLHAQMAKCDGILATMQETLLGFEADLGSASAELRSLQDASRRMSVKLANRKRAGAALGAFLRKIALKPAAFASICDGPVDERFLAAVARLDSTLRFVRDGAAPFERGARSVADEAPHRARLATKAAVRCRDYLLSKIDELHTEQTNVHMLQRTQLAAFSSLFRFLERHAPDHAAEVERVYVESMAETLHALFRAYVAGPEKGDFNSSV